MVAPTEPPALKKLGRVSSMPERYGVDFLWVARDLMHGAQRKTVSDLIASVEGAGGDRLERELGQMQGLETRVLIVEGDVAFTTEGVMQGRFGGKPWTSARWYGLLLGIQRRGCMVLTTKSTDGTARLLPVLEGWTSKERHGSTRGRPGPVSVWGRPDNRDWQIHLLTSLPGVGVELAERILAKFGRVPLRLDATRDELLEVEGIGPKKVDGILRCLGVEP